jgi:multidrug resistance efflux pump
MLNISQNKVYLQHKSLSSLDLVESKHSRRVLIRVMTIILLLFIGFLFLPWTQNIRARGNVTTLRPEQRPQTIPSVIAGRIEKWFVREGQYVDKGDTIVYISEIKDDYFDPKLLERTQEQLVSKEMSVKSYMEKIKALDNQIDALVQNSDLKFNQAKNKLKQAKLKITSDSIKFEAAKVDYEIAQKQFNRMEQLYGQGLKSLTDLEQKRLSLQKAQANLIAAENDLLTSKNEAINAAVEMNSVRAKFRDEIAKAESEKYTAMSNMYDAEISVTKLQNQYMNYSVRTGFYYIAAPQDGFISQSIQAGIGETVKEGQPIVSIVPSEYDLAVEMFVEPVDLPLMELGRDVRIQFDGWPAIIFSGWPNTSYGTYGGEIAAIDNVISRNGKYRILVSPDPEDHPWPDALRVGAGTNNMTLLKDVPIWYELWRQINGFPPDYYKDNPAVDINDNKDGTTDEEKSKK